MEEKQKKPFYKRWWFIALILIVAVGALGSGGEEAEDVTVKKLPTKQVGTELEPAEESNKVSVPKEYQSALKKAGLYASSMYMSKAGVYDQLISEHGENFSKEAAQYAIDNVEADWKENALQKAITYQDSMAMSPNAIYEQLISEYGERFTEEEANYAISNLPK